jgi:hypothetical protein
MMQRHQAFSDRLKQENEELIAQITARNERHEQRRQEVANAKLQKIKDENNTYLEKQRRLEEQKQMEKERIEQERQAAEKRWQEKEEASARARAQRELELKNKVRLQQLRDQFQAENARKIERLRKIEQDEKEQERQERQQRAALYLKLQEELAIKKRESQTKLEFQKAAILEEFRERMKRGGKLDIEGLAKSYDLDLDELRRRVDDDDVASRAST